MIGTRESLAEYQRLVLVFLATFENVISHRSMFLSVVERAVLGS